MRVRHRSDSVVDVLCGHGNEPWVAHRNASIQNVAISMPNSVSSLFIIAKYTSSSHYLPSRDPAANRQLGRTLIFLIGAIVR